MVFSPSLYKFIRLFDYFMHLIVIIKCKFRVTVFNINNKYSKDYFMQCFSEFLIYIKNNAALNLVASSIYFFHSIQYV